MIIAHMSGGFGNQLFSYAFAYVVAKERGEKLVIDTTLQDTKWFFRNSDILEANIAYDNRLTYRYYENPSLVQRIHGKLSKIIAYLKIGCLGTPTRIDEKDIEGKTDDPLKYCIDYPEKILYLRGDWCYPSYFSKYEDDIVRMYTFSRPLGKGASELEKRIKQKGTVGVHVRRGDLVGSGSASFLNDEYYLGVMNEVSRMIDDPVFYVFSDSICDVQNAFENNKAFNGFNITYCKYESSNPTIEDFRLFGLAETLICSKSSFSWWAAYLQQNQTEKKMIIYPWNEITDRVMPPMPGWIKKKY